MITTNNFLQQQIYGELLLEKAVVNLCANGHEIFASVQIINEGKTSIFIDGMIKKGILPEDIANRLKSLLDAYYE